MNKYLNDARHHARKIERYHKYGGANGYSQAWPHWDNLLKILRTLRSKNDTSAALDIQDIIEPLKIMMKEMKERKTISE